MKGRELRETLGLLAVVAPLGFVGFEIRQNTAAFESTAFQSINELRHEATALLTDESALVLRIRSGALPGDLTPEEDQWVRLMYYLHINQLQAAYHQVEVGALDEDVFDVFWTGLLSLDYIGAAWPSMRYSYDPALAEFFEALRATVPRSRASRIDPGTARRGPAASATPATAPGT